jgi:hypothetical protein
MQDEPKTVYVWRKGDEWRYTEDLAVAPPDAEKAKLFWHERELIIWINRGASGEFVRDAVKVK